MRSTALAYLSISLWYVGAMSAYFFFARVIWIGHIKGNGVKITDNQFPDIYKIIEEQSKTLGLYDIPDVYLLESHGVLNAFATRFLGSNYVVLYADVLEIALTEGPEAVAFITAHELGHIKRNHVSTLRRLVLLPSFFIPFLRLAYSRACEYTCDNIGFMLSPEGAKKGLLILASSTKLYKKIDMEAYIQNASEESSFSSWFAEIYSSHPHLTKRLANIVLKSSS